MFTPRVLAVDDDESIRHLVKFRLEKAGISCDMASSAEEALQLMEHNLYFVVISDIHMPGMGGVELVSALKEISPLVQVIMLTSDTCPEQVIACVDRGVVDFFGKRSDYGELVLMVMLVLSRYERWSTWFGRSRRPAEVGAAH